MTDFEEFCVHGVSLDEDCAACEEGAEDGTYDDDAPEDDEDDEDDDDDDE